MKKLIFTALVGLSMIAFTGCTTGNDASANTNNAKCSASGKCSTSGKCSSKKIDKKCSSSGKCSSGKCGK